MIAPFWADVDTRISNPLDPDEIGNVWFREEFDKQLLQRIQRDIRESFVKMSDFTPTWLFIVTWDAVGYFNRHIDKVGIAIIIIALIILLHLLFL